jgi:RsiW-degrading membrane proteinase PrsW (M82 family)
MTSSDPDSLPADFTASGADDVSTAAPVSAPAAVNQSATRVTQPGLTQPIRRGSLGLVLGIIGIILAALVLVVVVVYLITGLGGDAFALGGIMALIPLAIVFIVVRWIDRWEPEPRMAILFAFLWGAGVSVLIALIVGAEIENLIYAAGGPGDGYEFFSAAVQAPIVEETGKGLGLLLIFWFARKHFDGPVDGLVYAAWVAGGFAFTENILYFGSELLSAGTIVDGSVFEIFLIRGLMSPFAHVMFTAFTGIALGFAARKTGAIGAIGFFLLGLVPAILLHAFWNGALFFVYDFYGYYAVVQFPLFLIAVAIVIFLRRQEARLTHDRLTEYANVGWFNPDEINALATPNGRRQAVAWANQRGIGKVMKRYIHDATKLAFARQRIITGRNKIGAEADEAALLGAIVASRAALKSATAAAPGQGTPATQPPTT